MAEDGRKNGKAEKIEFLLRNLSAYISVIAFWALTFAWNYLFEDLEAVPRLGLSAALSWVIFLHVEWIGMIIMSMMRDRLRAEAREEARAREMLALAREAQAEAREARAGEARALEALAQAREARALEALAEARETLAQAREAAQAQERIRELERQLREARGESANGESNCA